MQNLKDINILVETASWKNSVVPSEIANLSGIRSTDIDYALLHTALWTRPPRYTGFDLSDCWAWLRYQRSFAATSNLTFRPEWKDIDSHQKTVSSDELGVGFTTQLLAEELDFLGYIDTKYMIEILGSSYLQFKNKAKRGQNKSPDYIAIDSNLSFSILECKGTQSSLNALNKSILSGVSQKKNVKPQNGTKVKHSLVAGLFVPQWDNSAKATIQISDPAWEDLWVFLSETAQENLLITFAQIALAKHFALMGFYSMANSLMNLNMKDRNVFRLSDIPHQDLDFLHRANSDYLTFTTDMPLPPHEMFEEDIRAKARRVNFQMNYPFENFKKIIESQNIFEIFEDVARNLEGRKWEHVNTDTTIELLSPFGFSLKMEFIY